MSREKKFMVCEPPVKVFSTKFWECHTYLHVHDWFSIP